MKLNHLYLLFIFFSLIGCIPVTQEPLTTVKLDINDPTFQKIYNYQDKQELDSLLAYTNHFNPSYRFMVANALASFQDPKGLDSLYTLLRDPVMKVRTAAAYAIGQIGDPKSTSELLAAFKTKDTLDVNNFYNSAIIEAIGKTGGKNLLPALATVSTYRNTDTLLIIGQCRAIYNYALRGITTTEGTDKMVQYLTEEGFPESVKLIAANYLYRAKDLDLTNYKFRIEEVFTKSSDPFIKSALAIVLGKTKDKEIFATLIKELETNEDYRVKANVVRSLSNFPYIQVIDRILKTLNDPNLHVATTAADYLINHGNRNDATFYRDYINDSLHYSIQAKILGSFLKHIPVYYTNTKAQTTQMIKERIAASSDPYEVAAYITALGYDPFNYKEVITLSSDSKDAVVISSGATALSNIVTSPNFIAAFRGGQRQIKSEIIDIIKAEIEKGDVGALAIYGELLSNSKVDLKPLIADASFLQEALKKLKLPQEVETYNSLGKAYAFLADTTFNALTPKWNHQINWPILSTYGDSIQVAIKTNKGVIRTKMYPHEAPGSVANFLTLSIDNYYDNKFIHRVVPNFVIQGGCPRGDGYGALDYTIRSELAQLYYEDEGYLGMASAGLHTEGTQWFITHSPAMHLNGKYTIFGKVFDGMDVVHALQVGDKIEDVIITKL